MALDGTLLAILVCPEDRGALLLVDGHLYNPRLRRKYRIDDGIPVLLIDELSLGLSPLIVSALCDVVRTLQRNGITIVVVEQSLNVALQVADRAVFLEKGQVRFEGPAQDLADRDDLARAVFLGREGG